MTALGRYRMLVGVVLAAATAQAPHLAAQVSETQVRAVFLFRFTQFVDWPLEPPGGSQLASCIGLLGDDPFDGFLDDTVRGEEFASQPIEVRRFQTIEQAGGCPILFVSGSEQSRLREILRAIGGRSVLTVGESSGFARSGGMIEFGTANGRTRLTINVDAARAANLTISSQLLRAATIVSSPG